MAAKVVEKKRPLSKPTLFVRERFREGWTIEMIAAQLRWKPASVEMHLRSQPVSATKREPMRRRANRIIHDDHRCEARLGTPHNREIRCELVARAERDGMRVCNIHRRSKTAQRWQGEPR